MMPDTNRELPYDGAMEMLLVDDVENKEFLRELLDEMYEEFPELPASKKKKQAHTKASTPFSYLPSWIWRS